MRPLHPMAPPDYSDSLVEVVYHELELILERRDETFPDPRHANREAARDAREDRLEEVRRKIMEVRDGSEDAALMRARVAMLEEGVTGLALSGGGIRSATFAVGFLQGLANLGLLRRFDYLSSVSGGGYAMGWLAAWLKRDGDPRNVERQLDFSRVGQASARRFGFNPDQWPRPVVDEEPQPLRHLRSFSSYLFPNPGLLSADVWTVVMIWLRNVVVNLLMLFPIAMLFVLLLRFSVFCFNYVNADQLPNLAWGRIVAWFFFLTGSGAAFLASFFNSRALPEFRRGTPRPSNLAATSWIALMAALAAAMGLTAGSRWVWRDVTEWLGQRLPRDRDTVWGNLIGLSQEYPDLLQPPSFAIVTILFAAGVTIVAFWGELQDSRAKRYFLWSVFIALAGAALVALQPTVGLLTIAAAAILAIWTLVKIVLPARKVTWAFIRAGFLSGATAGFLFVLLLGLIQMFARMNRPDLMATFAVPAALGVSIAAQIVEVAIAGRAMSEEEREWWGRFSARQTIASILWLVGMGAVVYLPGLFLWSGSFARTVLASGWLMTTAVGILTGRFVLPKLQEQGKRDGILPTAAAVAPPVFLIGLLGLVGLVASLLLNSPSLRAPNAADFSMFSYYIEGVAGTSGWLIIALGVASAAAALLGFVLIDVNLFSLNRMYGNRLVRCYLGASRAVAQWRPRWVNPRDPRVAVGASSLSAFEADEVRDPHPVSRFAAGDDLPLASLKIGSATNQGVSTNRAYWGPHLLINTTLNLVAGADLAWRSRKGESFVLSPLYCGAKTLGYARTPEDQPLEGGLRFTSDGITLGQSMAVSGAAVDPSMKFFQTRALTALLTLFNARLGAWVQNPRFPSWFRRDPNARWTAASPHYGGLLLTELFGKTDADGPYVHLSDGGHFENLGVYELIRRRCRYIVVLDAGDEAGSSNSNLAELIRLCRIDFGIRIQIDTEALSPNGPENLTRAHAVVGRICYDDIDQGQLPGVLVYVKASMTGDEPPDVQNYARCNTRFPYQPTDLRQSFDEPQFESYRCLGDHVAVKVFGSAVHHVRDQGDLSYAEFASRLFSTLQGELGDALALQDMKFVESTQAWVDLHRDFRGDPALARLSRQLYPELPPAPEPVQNASPLDYDRAEVHAVSQMLQIMENTWRTVGQRRLADLPMNRGWVNVFRRWVDTPAFQALWPYLLPEYGTDFARFCEEELHLRAAEPVCQQIKRKVGGSSIIQKFQHAEIAKLREEFEREWFVAGVPMLGELLERCRRFGRSDGDLPAWLIVQNPSKPDKPTGGPPGKPFAVGVVLAAPFNDLDDSFPEIPIDANDLPVVVRGKPIELLVWMRRGFRSTNLAAKQVGDVLNAELGPALGLQPGEPFPTLWTRYPKSGDHGDEDHEFGVWTSFYSRFDFRRVHPARQGDWTWSLLRRDVR